MPAAGTERVAVVVDSTSYLPDGMAQQVGIAVVPVQVIVDGTAFDETQVGQAERVADALRNWRIVTTSRPSPVRFLQAYRQAQESGATAVVALTLSSAMSATYESAVIAADEVDLPVEVVDSRSIAMGLGFAAVTAARVARRGGTLAQVCLAARERARLTSVYFYVDTLEYLRRGGRVGAARAAVGQVLQVKPLLQVRDGRVERLDQVRTANRALSRLVDLAVAAAQQARRDGASGVDVAVQHLDAPTRAEELAHALRSRLPESDVLLAVVGGVVGAHVGPGMVAVVVAPHADESVDGIERGSQ